LNAQSFLLVVSGRRPAGPVLLGDDKMAYDRFDTRDRPRDEHSRWSNDRYSQGERGWRGDNRGRRDERGFWDRASDEVASWFGDSDAERRRNQDEMREDRDQRERGRFSSRERDYDRGYGRDRDRSQDRNWYETRGLNDRGGFSESDYNPDWRRELSGGRERDRWDENDRGYRPITGDYGRSERSFGAGRSERGSRHYDPRGDRPDTPWGSDEYRETSRGGTSDRSDRSRHEDPHYDSWRRRHMDELDRDYDAYRSENQSRFESDFGSWRQRRQEKRGILGQVREHMEVVGSDDKHVGKVDKVAGDRIILAKSDPESGGVHHSLSCSDIGRVEGDRVILDCSADQARNRWRDESRSRALFEREDQGEMGPRMLDRSFEGTYR
jgi:hypothetical protein